MNTTLESENTRLSGLLRIATETVHGQVEGGEFIKRIFAGTVTGQEYYAYLWSLREVYETLEEGLARHASHPSLRAVAFAELNRVEELRADLKEWKSHEIAISKPLKFAVDAYSDRLKLLSDKDPALLVAHAYVRYLGDLSGGQILARVLRRRFPQAKGFAFYEFPQVKNIVEMKAKYREGLDQVGWLEPQRVSDLCAEAIRAFQLNGGVFAALSGEACGPNN